MYKKTKYQSEDIVFGRNSVMEAMKADRSINKILVSKGDKKGSIHQLIGMAKEKRIIIQEVESNYLNNICDGEVHQGVVALVSPFQYSNIEDILRKAQESDRKPFIVIVDGITDPYNLGALIRSAEVLGAHGLVIPRRNNVPLTSTVAKASAGALEHLPVCREVNISNCINNLKKQGIWIIGADMDGSPLYDTDFDIPVALVIGGEDKGLGRLVKEMCDIVVNIPVIGKVSSLNASVAGGIIMYEIARQRGC